MSGNFIVNYWVIEFLYTKCYTHQDVAFGGWKGHTQYFPPGDQRILRITKYGDGFVLQLHKSSSVNFNPSHEQRVQLEEVSKCMLPPFVELIDCPKITAVVRVGLVKSAASFFPSAQMNKCLR